MWDFLIKNWIGLAWGVPIGAIIGFILAAVLAMDSTDDDQIPLESRAKKEMKRGGDLG
jgi:hypothetical protein